MSLQGVKSFIIDKLSTGLNPLLTYHNVEHTLSVYQAVKIIADSEKVREQEKDLLLTAALFHDSGFLIDRNEHEKHSCEIAKKFLPGSNYTNAQIEKICSIIMATTSGYKPKNILEMIIRDADVDCLGTDLYQEISERLYTELKNFGQIPEDEKSWLKLQVNYLKHHKYYTKSSKNLRETSKQKTLNLLLTKL
jgi:HD superfamily phosphodiesterase